MGRKKVDDDDETPLTITAPPEWERPGVAKRVQELLESLEITKIDAEARMTLHRWIYRCDRHFGGDRGSIIFALRAIVESEGNGQDALIDTVLCAVHSACLPEWTRKGLAFIEAFDQIDLRALLRTMRYLRCFTKDDVGIYLTRAIRSRLWEIFGPDVVEPAKPKPRPKAKRPAGISEEAWSDFVSRLKKVNRRKAAMAPN